MAEEPRLVGASMADYAKWSEENPAIALTAEVVIHIRPEDIKCDQCGKPADTIHFLELNDRDSVEVKFACGEHDLGGYWVDMKRFVNPREEFVSHIAQKNWGLHGLATLRTRLSEIERARMIEEGVLK